MILIHIQIFCGQSATVHKEKSFAGLQNRRVHGTVPSAELNCPAPRRFQSESTADEPDWDGGGQKWREDGEK